MNLKALMTAILKAAWPGGASAPSVGSMAGNALAVPDTNIDRLSDASTTAAIVAASQGNPTFPISSVKITVTGKGTDELVGRYVDE
jgi:hypothetical protein